MKRSSLKSNTSEVSLNLHYTTEKRLDTLDFFNNDIRLHKITYTKH